MASILIANISNVLEKVIAPAIQSQLFETNELLKWLPKNMGITKLDNNEFNVTLLVKRNPSVGSIPKTSTTLPTEMKDITSQTKAESKYTYGNLRFDDRTIEATKSDKGALKQIVEVYGDQGRKDLAKEMNFQFWRFGNGKLATTTDNPAATTTVTVDSTDYIVEGQYVKVGATAVTQVVSVDSATQFTVADSIDYGSGDAVIRYISATVAADNMMGFQGIVDDGTNVATLQNIARASNPWWKAYVDAASEALSEADMVTALLQGKKFASPDDEYRIWTGLNLWKSYGALLTAVTGSPKRLVNQKAYTGGWGTLMFMDDIEVKLDYDVPSGEMYFINQKSVTLGQLTPVGFMPGSNGVLTRVPGSTDWEATLRFYGNLIARNVRQNAVLRNKT